MTPYKHAESSARMYGGEPLDYIDLHEWFDCTKVHTGDWTHRALRHHALGIQESIAVFGHLIQNSSGKYVPTKLLAERHVTEDCGFIPTVQDWFAPMKKHPEPWMLSVRKTTTEELRVI